MGFLKLVGGTDVDGTAKIMKALKLASLSFSARPGQCEGAGADVHGFPHTAATQSQLENHVRELLLNLYLPEIGLDVRDALAVIRDCSVKKLPLASSPRLRFTRQLNDRGIFVEVAFPEEGLDVPLYLYVLGTDLLLSAQPELTEYRTIFDTEIAFG